MRIVCIKWTDSGCIPGWRALDQHKGSPPTIESVGYLLEKDDKHVTILQSVSSWGGGDNSLTIPRSTIKQIITL